MNLLRFFKKKKEEKKKDWLSKFRTIRSSFAEFLGMTDEEYRKFCEEDGTIPDRLKKPQND